MGKPNGKRVKNAAPATRPLPRLVQGRRSGPFGRSFPGAVFASGGGVHSRGRRVWSVDWPPQERPPRARNGPAAAAGPSSEAHGNLNGELARRTYKSTYVPYTHTFLTSKRNHPYCGGFAGPENCRFRGILGVIRMRRAAPAWQHGGMTWRTAGGGTGSIAARAAEGAERSGAPSRRLLAGNFTGFSQPTRYLMALCYFSSHFCSARNVGGPRGPRHERTTGILTVWAGAPRMTWTVS